MNSHFLRNSVLGVAVVAATFLATSARAERSTSLDEPDIIRTYGDISANEDPGAKAYINDQREVRPFGEQLQKSYENSDEMAVPQKSKKPTHGTRMQKAKKPPSQGGNKATRTVRKAPGAKTAKLAKPKAQAQR